MMNSFVQIFGIYAHFYKYMHMLTGDFESLVDGARRDFEAKEATMLENERVLREQVLCLCVCVCVHVCMHAHTGSTPAQAAVERGRRVADAEA